MMPSEIPQALPPEEGSSETRETTKDSVEQIREIIRERFKGVGNQKNIEAALGEVGIDLPDDEEERLIAFITELAPLFADIDTLVETGIKENEFTNHALMALGKRLREVPPTSKHKIFEAIAQVIDGQAHKGTSASFIVKCAEKLLRTLSTDEAWNCAKRMDRDASHARYLTQLEDNKELVMMTGRPLRLHTKALGLSPETLQSLNKESLLLIGGGPSSPLPSELQEQGIHPLSIVNIDPGAAPETAKEGYVPMQSTLLEANIPRGKFAEVWALHSVPTYALADEIPASYSKALMALRTGGVLRISPIYGYSAPITPPLAFSTRMSWRMSKLFIDGLKERPDLFDVHIFQGTEDLTYKNAINPLGKVMGTETESETNLASASITAKGNEQERELFVSELTERLNAQL